MKRLFDCHCDTLTKVMECEQNLKQYADRYSQIK
jgi:hypothetical protein